MWERFFLLAVVSCSFEMSKKKVLHVQCITLGSDIGTQWNVHNEITSMSIRTSIFMEY